MEVVTKDDNGEQVSGIIVKHKEGNTLKSIIFQQLTTYLSWFLKGDEEVYEASIMEIFDYLEVNKALFKWDFQQRNGDFFLQIQSKS